MDFHVKSQDGQHFIVEMQSQRHVMFDERALFYTASVYTRQLEEKKYNDPLWFKSLKPVIALQVLDYQTDRIKGINLEGSEQIDPLDQPFLERVRQHPLYPKFIKHFKMQDQNSGESLDHLQMIQIELPGAKVPKAIQPGEQVSNQDWWIRILKYAHEYTEQEVRKTKPPAFVEAAFERLNKRKWDPRMMQEYQTSLVDTKAYRTHWAIERDEGKKEGLAEGEAKGKKEGLAEGKKEGLAEGRKREREEMLKNLIAKRIDNNMLIQFGFSQEEIDDVKNMIHSQ